MLYITQSNDVNRLFEYLLQDYQQKNRQVFEPFIVIVPSKVMGDWLKKQVADRAGISTLITAEFWGRYQWTLMQNILKQYEQVSPSKVLRVPEVAVLSQRVMQWRIFGFFVKEKLVIMANTGHPLHDLVVPLLQNKQSISTQAMPSISDALDISAVVTPNPSLDFDNYASNTYSKNILKTDEQRLWQLADDMARMLGRYMTYRPNWLDQWGRGEALDVEAMTAHKDEMMNLLNLTHNEQYTPTWLVEQYTQLEIAQRYLWQQLFHDTYQYRQAIEAQFWQALTHPDTAIAQACRAVLPERIVLFTLQQLPATELTMIKRLAKYMDIKLLHYNPSQMFWADIVDKNWLLTRRFIHPETVYYKDYGHTLLSRFGKQSREVFAMLADLVGNDYEQQLWHDDFIATRFDNINTTASPTLLQQLQQDILMLQEKSVGQQMQDILASLTQRIYQPPRQWQYQHQDNSLSIHACHSTLRQLEVLRSMLIGWLNYSDKPTALPNVGGQIDFLQHAQTSTLTVEERRNLSDILILMPDIEAQQTLIESIFPTGVGSDGYDLPAKVTGVVSKDINQLWTAMVGYFNLLNEAGARFDKASVFDWLMLPPLYESFGLSHEEMTRGCELLEQAGFIRGFDEVHLLGNLHPHDDDYRFTFAFALERLVAGVLMPQAMSTEFGEYINQQGERERVLPLANVQLSDMPIVAVLTNIYQTIHQYRNSSHQLATAEEWLEMIETFIHNKFSRFEQTNALNAIWAAQNAFRQNIFANQRYGNFSLSHQLSKGPQDTISVKPEDLPLKLGFILASMATELASQQVSAEPAGVITFGRIGAVRNLPYKLIVMLNMNLADFPSRDTFNRYDLMQADIAQKGDRFKEDDELGAFLDAILAAKEACWLFYNGASVNDSNEHLPASPVQELIGFLSDEVQWQTPSFEFDEPVNNSQTAQTIAKPVPQAIPTHLITDWLVTHHPALPFATEYFYHLVPAHATTMNPTHVEPPILTSRLIKEQQQALYPPARIWHGVFEQLQQHKNPFIEVANKATDKIMEAANTSNSKPASKPSSKPDQTQHKIQLWQETQLQSQLQAWQTAVEMSHTQTDDLSKIAIIKAGKQVHINLDTVIRGVQRPAQHFIQSHQIRLATPIAAEATNEPLDLDSLAMYQVNAYIIEQLKSQQPDKTDEPTQPYAKAHKTKTGVRQKLELLPFSHELPAGVSRHWVLKTQQKQMQAGFNSLLTKIRQAEDLPTLAKSLLQNSLATKADCTDLSASEIIASLITACTEQKIMVSIPYLTEQTTIDKARTPKEQKSQEKSALSPDLFFITVNLPESTITQQATDKKTDTILYNHPSYWLQYLPTSGQEKYQVQFWLNHLCWQVLRQTTAEQVSDNDGFSLWQFSTKNTWYLPPIQAQTAYHYLQLWLMYWQLAAHELMVLPPSVTLKYLQAQHTNAKDNKGEMTDTDKIKLLDKLRWKAQNFGDFIDEDMPEHPTWQFLLAGYEVERVIQPFLDNLGIALYQPLIEHMQKIET